MGVGKGLGNQGTAVQTAWAERLYLRLRRVTTSGDFFAVIDGLRFVAIAAVLLCHIDSLPFGMELSELVARSPVARVVMRGHFGVQLFFVISGFILSTPFAEHALRGRKPVNLRAFLTRRLTRLEPPYIVCLVVLLLGKVLLLGASLRELAPHLLVSIGYLHNIVYGAPSVLNLPAWSLEVEIQFYLAAPLLGQVFRIQSAGLRRALIVGGVLAAMAGQSAALAAVGGTSLENSALPYGVRGSLLYHIQYFLLGLLLADLHVTRWRDRPGHSRWWDLAATAGLVGVFATVDNSPWQLWLLPPLTLLFYVGVFRGVWWHALLSWRWIVVVGGMCYTTYLWHLPLMHYSDLVLQKVLPPLPLHGLLAARALLLLPLVWLVSAGLFLVLEKPFMYPDWPARLRRWVARGGAGQT